MTQTIYYVIIKTTDQIGGSSFMKKLIFAIIAIVAVLFVIRVIKEKKARANKDPLDLEDDE